MLNVDNIINNYSENWRAEAVCKGMTHLFFEVPGERTSQRDRRVRTAKQICKVCPVIDICLNVAIENDEIGVWGGTTDEERRRMNRTQPIKRLVNQ